MPLYRANASQSRNFQTAPGRLNASWGGGTGTDPATSRVQSRWRFWLALAVATPVSIIVSAIAVLPLLVDTDAVKRMLEQRVLQVAGAEVNYESLSLHLMPPVRAEFSGVTIRLPGAIEGRIAALQIRIAWLPLLAGKVRPTAVRIDRPALEVRIAPAQTADPFAAYRAALGPIVDSLVRDVAGIPVRIERGKLAVVYAGRRIVTLSDLEGAAELSAGAIVARASAAADLWRVAQAEVTIVPGSLAASAKLQVSGLRATQILDAYQSHDAVQVRLDAVDATLDAATDGYSTIQGSVLAAAPEAALDRAGRTLSLGAIRIALDVSRDGDALVLALREFRAGDLISGVVGTLRAKPDGAGPVLELRVPRLDLARLGAAAFVLAADVEAVRTAVNRFRGGTLGGLTLNGAAGDLAGLADPSSMRAAARLDAATIAVSEAGIVVRNGSGRFVLVDGALHGSELAGHIERSSFDSGALAVRFAPAPSLRSLRAAFKADLPDALAISCHLLERQNPEALGGIEALRGRASGTISYDALREGSPLVVELANIQATGRYRGVPFPLEVSRGDLRYSGHSVLVRGLAGSAGGSRLRDAGFDVALVPEPVIRSASGEAMLALTEFQPWVSSLNGLPPALRDLKGATGTAAVRLLQLSGPISRPASLEFDIRVQPREVKLTSTALPGPLTLAMGSLSVTRRTLRLEQVQAALLDARVTASGTVENYAAPERRVSLPLVKGTFGTEAIDWLRMRWKLPVESMPRAPIAVSAARAEWTGKSRGALAAQGTAGLAAGAQVEFDLAWQPDRLDVRRLVLKDADSDAAFRVQWSPAVAEVAFNGRLHYRTLERSLALPPQTHAIVQADFRASINLTEPHRSSADGILEVEGLDFQKYGGVPVTIERLSAEATGRTVRVRDGVVWLAGERLAVSGTVESRERFTVDARVSAEDVDAARLLSAFRRGRPGNAWRDATWNFPVDGRVAITAASVAYGGRALQPFSAAVSLAPNRVVVEGKDVRLCGIAIPFTAALVPGGVEASARLTARNQSLAYAGRCVAGDLFAITGHFDLDAEFSARGSAGALLEGTRGSFRAAARDGRIYRAPTLSRTLAVEEVAARARAATSDLMAGGLKYDEIDLAGTLEGGRVRLDRGMLDSPSLAMTVSGEIDLADGRLDLQGLVAPLDTFQRVIRRFPILGRAFGTPLVVIPVSISGDVKNPEVEVLGAGAVGATLINLMTAMFLMPVHLFNSMVGTSQR